MSRLPSLSSLRESAVVRPLLLYAGAAWVILQGVSLLQDDLHLPEWVTPLTLVLLIIGFVVAVTIALLNASRTRRVKLEVSGSREILLDSSATKAARRRWGIFAGACLAVVGIGLLGSFAWSRLKDNAASNRTSASATPEPSQVTTTARNPERASLAVLPFVNMSTDEENQYFADGLTDDVITHLSKIGAFRVISRTSVMHYKGTGKNLREIARELGVERVIEGSVRRSGDRLRISAQLIDASTGIF